MIRRVSFQREIFSFCKFQHLNKWFTCFTFCFTLTARHAFSFVHSLLHFVYFPSLSIYNMCYCEFALYYIAQFRVEQIFHISIVLISHKFIELNHMPQFYTGTNCWNLLTHSVCSAICSHMMWTNLKRKKTAVKDKSDEKEEEKKQSPHI